MADRSFRYSFSHAPEESAPVDPRALKKLLKPWAKIALGPETSAAILEAVSTVRGRWYSITFSGRT